MKAAKVGENACSASWIETSDRERARQGSRLQHGEIGDDLGAPVNGKGSPALPITAASRQ
jgi:hypothetical protein